MRLEYLILKSETKTNTVNIPEDNKIIDLDKGTIDLENIAQSSAEKEIFKIPPKNQKELKEKGETEFTIITETYVNLKVV